jgi:hypothetical protein
MLHDPVEPEALKDMLLDFGVLFGQVCVPVPLPDTPLVVCANTSWLKSEPNHDAEGVTASATANKARNAIFQPNLAVLSVEDYLCPMLDWYLA